MIVNLPSFLVNRGTQIYRKTLLRRRQLFLRSVVATIGFTAFIASGVNCCCQSSRTDGLQLPDTNALWRIVQTAECSPESRSCFERNNAKGYVVIKDRDGVNQLLLLPTAQIAGIDDPNLSSVDTVNLFAMAWESRKWSHALAALPPDRLSLALNSYVSRTQDQLHIHIDCVDKDVHKSLEGLWTAISYQWQPIPRELKGHKYYARRIDNLNAESPLALLRSIGMTKEDIGRWTLVVVGAPAKQPGFVILADRADGEKDRAWGEELQDHNCMQ